LQANNESVFARSQRECSLRNEDTHERTPTVNGQLNINLNQNRSFGEAPGLVACFILIKLLNCQVSSQNVERHWLRKTQLIRWCVREWLTKNKH